MLPPNDAQGVKRVMGMLAYYRRFVPNFAATAEPLTRLTRKKVTFKWGAEQAQGFKKLSQELAVNAVLVHFTHSNPITLKTDAGKAGIA